MSRIPSHPFRVVVNRKRVAGIEQPAEWHNYTTLAGAIAYRDIVLRKPSTHKVSVFVVIDETTPEHKQTEPESKIVSSRS